MSDTLAFYQGLQDRGMDNTWIIFKPTKDDLDTFLRENAPSKVSSTNGCKWIYVRRPTGSPGPREVHRDDFELDEKVLSLRCAWEELCASGRPTHQDICNLAVAQRCLSGKWLIFSTTGTEVDQLWSKIARAVIDGKLGPSAKVSSHTPKQLHVICVYNDNFTDEKAVRNLESDIRALEIFQDMTYKPDLFTHLGIYAKNNWNVKSTVYSSKFDREKKQWVFGYDLPMSSEPRLQRKLTEYMYMGKFSSSPHKNTIPSSKLHFAPTSRATRSPARSTGRSKVKKRLLAAATSKTQTKLSNYFNDVSKPAVTGKHPPADLSIEDEPINKLPKQAESSGGPNRLASGLGGPPLPTLDLP